MLDPIDAREHAEHVVTEAEAEARASDDFYADLGFS
jgi:hypothetical protein